MGPMGSRSDKKGGFGQCVITSEPLIAHDPPRLPTQAPRAVSAPLFVLITLPGLHSVCLAGSN